jgi:hypothetical protein
LGVDVLSSERVGFVEQVQRVKTEPTRRLTGPKPHRYVKADHTDIRRTFRKARLFAYLQRAKT